MIGIERKEKQSKPIKKSSSFGTVGILIGLCLLLGWCSQNQNSNKTAVMPTARSTGTAAATATTGATVTAAPTYTAVSTRTAAPTSIPSSKAGLPGLMPADIYLNFEQKYGAFCNRGNKSEKKYTTWSCTKGDVFEVTYITERLQVEAVIARVFTTNRSAAGAILAFTASLPYDGADPKAAMGWVTTSAADRSKTVFTTTIGGVEFLLAFDLDQSALVMGKLPEQ